MNLDDLRTDIDAIDDQLAQLFSQRMKCAGQIARYKTDNGLPVINRGRERAILDRVTAQCGDDLAVYTKILFSTLFDLSRSRQREAMIGPSALAERIAAAAAATPRLFPARAAVACQGVEGAYSQQACDKLFSLPAIMYFNSFENVFQAVDKGLCRYGILPIENSSCGSVTEVYDLMKRHSVYIARSTRLQINHALLAGPGATLGQIREIFSHEQAIGQCGKFIGRFKDAKITLCENTAMAAKIVRESGRGDAAAISSRSCAELYGLSVLADHIQDSDNNYTRFICISKDLEIYPGANKISFMLSTAHRPGSLYSTIAKFSALGINLCKLESRPIPGSNFEFMFYLDMDASVDSLPLLQLLGDFDRSPELFVFLGNYSEV